MVNSFGIIPGAIIGSIIDDKKTKEEKEEAWRRDFEKSHKINKEDFVLRNDKALKHLKENYRSDFTYEENKSFREHIVTIGAYRLIFDEWFISEEQSIFTLLKSKNK